MKSKLQIYKQIYWHFRLFFLRSNLVRRWHQQGDRCRQSRSLRLGAPNHQDQCPASRLRGCLPDSVRRRDDQKPTGRRRATDAPNGTRHGSANDVKRFVWLPGEPPLFPGATDTSGSLCWILLMSLLFASAQLNQRATLVSIVHPLWTMWLPN